MLAVLSFTYVPLQTQIPMDISFAMYAIKEALIGLAMGFVLQILFAALQIAGGLMDMQMGFAMANVIDPMTGVYIPITGRFKNIIATLYYLSINGHHLFIQGILTSYKLIPIDMAWIPIGGEAFFLFMLKAFSYMFLSGFLMASPIIVALFLVDLSLGIIAKTVPQFNIFVVGLPIKIFVSFFLLIIVMPGFLYVLGGLFEKMFGALSEVMTILGG